MTETDWTLEVIASLDGISSADWNSCAPDGNPFVSYEFLYALEASRSAVPETGWYAQHLVLRDQTKQVRAVVPAYLKNHSQGEYVFDQSWAEAFQRAGGNYYPKLQISVPFTPATGPRLLVKPGSDDKVIFRALDQGIQSLCKRHHLSSAHITFLPEKQSEAMGKLGWLQRTDTQFHWQNPGYKNFDEFLSALSSRKRKNIRKERSEIARSKFTFELLAGKDIFEGHWDQFFAFYQDTGARKWGTPYLTRDFFSQVGETMANNILLILAKRAGRCVAGALNFVGSDTLFGRYWGALEDHQGLHFETCYYQAMAFAIEHNLTRVEAGAQGPHKLARGYVPVTTFSAHHIANPDFSAAINDYLHRERTYVAEDKKILSNHAPFRKGTDQ